MASQRFTREETGPPGPRETRWTWLLVIPLLGTLIPTIYNTNDPELIGIPFFYWYQLMWIIIGAILTAIVYFATED